MFKVFKLLPLMLLVAVSGCKTKPSCELTAKYSTTVGNGLGDFFGCKNKEKIAKDLQGKIEDLNLCAEQQTGPIAAVICKPVASYVASLIVDKTFPKSWECSGGVPGTALELAIYQSCSALPF